MTPFSFDTLGASKQLREAGMPEGMAEAVVSVFHHAAMTPDVSHLATKEDLETVRADMTTKLLEQEVRVTERMRQQSWAMLGGTATIVAIATAIIKLA